MSNFSKANTDIQWFQDDFPGADLRLTEDTTVLVLHTTEGTSWPSYNGGSSAPHYTHLPSLKGGNGSWRAHFPDEKSSRALRNEAGGVETNTLNALQVELIGTCDPKHRKSWDGQGKRLAGRDYVYWPDATDVQLAGVAVLIADLHQRHGLKLVAPEFDPYPASISSERFTFAQWRNFAGICGHQHVPENHHGDPGDIDIDKLIALTKAMLKTPTPARQSTVLHVQHVSMQRDDRPAQQQADLTRIFSRAQERGVAWITGTEVNEGGFVERLIDTALRHGYRLGRASHNDSWVAVSEKIITGGWKVNFTPVLPAVKGKHTARGVLGVEFDTEHLGHITVIGMHLLINGDPKAPLAADRRNVADNAKLLTAAAKFADKQSAGSNLVFYGGDQNINDRRGDTFMGKDFTSAGDELEKWPNTGHGPIDVTASHDADSRVSAAYTRVLTDAKLPLNTDHYLVEAGFTVRHI